MPPACPTNDQPRDSIPAWLWIVGVGSLIYTTALISTGVQQDWWARRWAFQRIAESCRRGDQIVVALEAYAEDRGTYPKRLEALIPNYLPSIPPPVAGATRWEYSGGEFRGDQVFLLRFTARGGWPYKIRRQGDTKWDDSDRLFGGAAYDDPSYD